MNIIHRFRVVIRCDRYLYNFYNFFNCFNCYFRRFWCSRDGVCLQDLCGCGFNGLALGCVAAAGSQKQEKDTQ